MFIKADGCYSYVGKKWNGGEQFVSLAAGCLKQIGPAHHEIMHALGKDQSVDNENKTMF